MGEAVKDIALESERRSRVGHTVDMPVARTARDRARDELTREIKAAARGRLAQDGAAALSVRAVARDLGLAPSALYRYFANRDALLTALIIEAYDSLADHVEETLSSLPPEEFSARWRASWGAVRAWAHEHPHEYALIYGFPVPGYAAPSDTIPSGARVPLLLLRLVRDARAAGALADPSACPAVPHDVAAQADHLAAATDLEDIPRPILLRAVIAWTQLFGMVSFELFGQLTGAFTDNTPLFTFAADLMADTVGFRRQP